MKTIIVLAAFAATLSAVPAPAQEPVRQVVQTADLDLANPRDVARLDRRIRSAVAAACGPVSAADPAGANAARQCRAETRPGVALERSRAMAAAKRPTEVAAAGF